MRIRTLARATATAVTLTAALGVAAPAGAAAGSLPPGGVDGVKVPKLDWKDCGEGFQCATAKVPRDYAKPKGKTFQLALVRKPATGEGERIGSVFFNPGGPGGSGTELVRGAAEDFAALNERFDLVGFDPRGVPGSKPSVRCLDDAETEARATRPHIRPQTLHVQQWVSEALRYAATCVQRNRGVLEHLSTVNVTRDLDLLRAAVGDEELTYLGYSYGTYIGATYASLFGDRARALILDGAVDPHVYANDPLAGTYDQTKAFERQLGRFFDRCAQAQPDCGFGGSDPRAAFDALAGRLDDQPLAVGDRTVDGDAMRLAAIQAMYSPGLWAPLAKALALAQRGDGSLLRQLADLAIGRDENGSYDGFGDRFYAIYGVDGDWPGSVGTYQQAGERAYAEFPHFWFNHGYSELAWGLYPVQPRGWFGGPFRNPDDAPAALVLGTTYDPATPYEDAQKMVAQLGNARLLTWDGDGHTASYYGDPCIDDRVTAYAERGELPPAGTVCKQPGDPFATTATATKQRTRAAIRRAVDELHAAPRLPVR